jgi:hypothetical protein
MAKAVGYWAVMIWDNELFKYGKDGDVKEPYATFEQAEDQIDYLREDQKEGDDYNYYILEVFNTGQIRTFDEPFED